jgi:hypothetical protein
MLQLAPACFLYVSSRLQQVVFCEMTPRSQVRKATLFHFLEDGSIKISEKRMENRRVHLTTFCNQHVFMIYYVYKGLKYRSHV